METEVKTTNSIETSHSLDTTHTLDLSDKLYKVMIGIAAVGAIFLVGELLYQFKSLPQNMPREISVSGEGKAYIKPDIATISFGVNTREMKSQDAVNKNNETMNAVIKTVKDLGVDQKDIQTTLYNLTPVYEYDYPVMMPSSIGASEKMYPVPSRGERVFKGYSLDQQIFVKIRNFDNINPVLDKAAAAGATTIGELQFTIDDPEKVRAEAREKAIAQAKEKMDSLVKQSGLHVGKLVNVYEGYSNYPQPLYGMGGASLEKSADVAPQIQTGQMEVSTTVTLTYQVK
ncbi:MAG: hypothetical protein A2908_01310 [Candidatus Staskawiczbacteria bacterium RIFCSPLOWO2_01_FULL_38_12b]|uniref:DUF541 domain-containing protein n=1 Tax=Candidatus Staskawiczbacteria bacterium RIFCSPLOWO2_01_FULL_38_12b TaxID=1802214 RepID=A0A1G2IGC0_9BACT|nr:MAG: hypothetical protein A2908_01310 [Candidatus Staskawiczbacteria bacterium RIFCSPLOWO2_01_FULL_38_12b]